MKTARNSDTLRYPGMPVILGVFLIMAALLFAERSGIRYVIHQNASAYLEKDQVIRADEVETELPQTCLVVMDSRDESSVHIYEQFRQILKDMKVGYQVRDIAAAAKLGNLAPYETIVVLMSDLNPLGEEVLDIAQWVENGGSALFAMSLQNNVFASMLQQKLGIMSAGYDYVTAETFYPSADFMIGGGQDYVIVDPFDSAWNVELNERAKLYVWSNIGEHKVPLVWENDYGSGKFVVVNLGIYEKAVRGIYASAYSLLTDCTIYPVINGSVFYLDDFPSPVPGGNGKYVYRDYGMSISDFYANIWWPDMMSLADRYGIRYTGVVIENYEDETDGVVERQKDTARFQYFGNMLLRRGGEIGYHGYNHQPLSLGNVDYGDVLPYNTWVSEEAMNNAVDELIRFCREMYPDAQKSVYVPPSNVLSEEGRSLLGGKYPQIRTIASNYFSGEFAYEQEFEVAEDGIVEQPRVISGALLDDYMKMCAFSELNMHFVNTHFMHPDDLLDEDRGAVLGWETLKGNLKHYMDWLYTSAPELRNLTGSELSGAIQRYGAVAVRKERTEDGLCFHIENRYDKAYFFVRLTSEKPLEVTGGTLSRLTDSLYLLCADSDEVQVKTGR